MKKLIILFCLISTSCIAQEATTRIETVIGKLVIENANLSAALETSQKAASELKKQLEEALKEKTK